MASYGLLTVAGLTSFVLGSLMLIRSPFPALRVGLAVVLPTALAVAFVVMFLLARVLQEPPREADHRRRGLVGEIGEVVAGLGAERQGLRARGVLGRASRASLSRPAPASASSAELMARGWRWSRRGSGPRAGQDREA